MKVVFQLYKLFFSFLFLSQTKGRKSLQEPYCSVTDILLHLLGERECLGELWHCLRTIQHWYIMLSVSRWPEQAVDLTTGSRSESPPCRSPVISHMHMPTHTHTRTHARTHAHICTHVSRGRCAFSNGEQWKHYLNLYFAWLCFVLITQPNSAQFYILWYEH